LAVGFAGEVNSRRQGKRPRLAGGSFPAALRLFTLDALEELRQAPF